MSGGTAYVWDPKGRFANLCNVATVDLDPILPDDPAEEDDPDRPRQRSASVEDAGMGDLLRFDAPRLRILLERHHLFTGSARARTLLEDWQNALACFVKIMPKDYRRALLELQAERQAARTEAAE
jgi:glutamate synthase (NADPH/NADH) large chain